MLTQFMDQSAESDLRGETCSTEYEASPGESTVHAVLEAVAAVTETPVDELPSLYYSIDTEALDRLTAPGMDGTPRFDVSVEFTYYGTHVTVDERTVSVRPGEA